MSTATPDDVYMKLKEVIPNLPDHCMSLTLRLELDKPVLIDVTYYADNPLEGIHTGSFVLADL